MKTSEEEVLSLEAIHWSDDCSGKGFPQSFVAGMRVDQRRGDAPVPEGLLHQQDIAASLVEARGKGMTKAMR